MNIITKTNQKSRPHGRIALTPTENPFGEIEKKLIKHWATMTGHKPRSSDIIEKSDRRDPPKNLIDCWLSFKTRPHIGILREVNLKFKNYRSRRQKQYYTETNRGNHRNRIVHWCQLHRKNNIGSNRAKPPKEFSIYGCSRHQWLHSTSLKKRLIKQKMIIMKRTFILQNTLLMNSVSEILDSEHRPLTYNHQIQSLRRQSERKCSGINNRRASQAKKIWLIKDHKFL